MGNSHGHSHGHGHGQHSHGGSEKKAKVSESTFSSIPDRYKTLEEVQDALRKAGLESSNLILAIDYTKSNTWNGQRTFNNVCLHTLGQFFNPYQEVISIMGRTLEPFDDDKLIPVFGFGDITTTDKSVFPFFPDRVCYGFQEVLQRYNEITPNVQLSGPTSFAPVIREAVKIVSAAQAYHILVIIADGQVDSVKETAAAIIEASNHPLSIIMIGVGDGPWDTMRTFDDNLVGRKFDNFQFVPFFETMSRAENREITFSVSALQEIPDQYAAIKKMGYLNH